jgi:hypothetical protein
VHSQRETTPVAPAHGWPGTVVFHSHEMCCVQGGRFLQSPRWRRMPALQRENACSRATVRLGLAGTGLATGNTNMHVHWNMELSWHGGPYPTGFPEPAQSAQPTELRVEELRRQPSIAATGQERADQMLTSPETCNKAKAGSTLPGCSTCASG